MVRILVVEDNAPENDLLKDDVQDSFPGRVELVAVTDGEQASPLFKEHWDGVIVDLALPGKSGVMLLREMNVLPNFKNIPVRLVTAYLSGPTDDYARKILKNVEEASTNLDLRITYKPYELEEVRGFIGYVIQKAGG